MFPVMFNLLSLSFPISPLHPLPLPPLFRSHPGFHPFFFVSILSANSSPPGGSRLVASDSLPTSSDSSSASAASTSGIIPNPNTYGSSPPHAYAPIPTLSSPISNLSSPAPSPSPSPPRPSSPLPPTPPPSPPTQTHQMITRSRNNIYKPKRLDHTTLALIISKHPLPSTVEAVSIKAALADSQ